MILLESLPPSTMCHVILGPDNPSYRTGSKYKGDLQMKMSLRFTASGVLALIMGAACFGQHYTQTNLVSNESGIGRVESPRPAATVELVTARMKLRRCI
jgi:hypothetical protein